MRHRKLIGAFALAISSIGSITTSAGAALIDDAKKEGTLIFYGSMTTEHHGKLVAAFTQKYPFIRVEGFRANSLTVVKPGSHRAARRPADGGCDERR